MVLGRILDYVFVGYFASHIPITLLFDVQVLGDRFHPEIVSYWSLSLPWAGGWSCRQCHSKAKVSGSQTECDMSH